VQPVSSNALMVSRCDPQLTHSTVMVTMGRPPQWGSLLPGFLFTPHIIASGCGDTRGFKNPPPSPLPMGALPFHHHPAS
jgi:hypothetical protein